MKKLRVYIVIRWCKHPRIEGVYLRKSIAEQHAAGLAKKYVRETSVIEKTVKDFKGLGSVVNQVWGFKW